MKRNWKLEAALLAGIITGAAALAQPAGDPPAGGPGPRPGGPGDRGGPCGDQLVASLSLTADQQSALDTLRQQTADTIQPIAERTHTLHQQIDDAVAASSPDRCAIGDLTIQLGGLHAQVDAIRKAAEATFVASLSADQKARYDTFVGINPGCGAVGGGFGPPPIR
jgi:Spy/CpxP family protein refolding chaperone